MIRVELPYHLRMLGKIAGDVELEVGEPVTLGSVLDALESRYLMLRFYACEQDFSNERPDAPLPPAVASGAQPLLIIGAIAGG